MKKLIFIMLFALTASLGYSQDLNLDVKDVQLVELSIPDSTAITINKVYEDMKSGLTGLAKAMKAPVEHVYGILVRQQIVQALSYCIFPFFSLILALLLASVVKKSKWADSTYTSDENEYLNKYAGMTIALAIFLFVTIFGTFINFEDIVSGLVNPEYGAIKEIIEFVK